MRHSVLTAVSILYHIVGGGGGGGGGGRTLYMSISTYGSGITVMFNDCFRLYCRRFKHCWRVFLIMFFFVLLLFKDALKAFLLTVISAWLTNRDHITDSLSINQTVKQMCLLYVYRDLHNAFPGSEKHTQKPVSH